MCGILGCIDPHKRVSNSQFEQALSNMKLRGPDASGVFTDGEVFLGHRRLSIIDVSDAANQPITDAEQRYYLIFNGEIFNFKELKKDKLEAYHHLLTTESDSEVLLHLLIHFGEECLSWLAGFFAFAFYDTHDKKMIIARDRFGKKPLVVYQHEGLCVFGSELKSVSELMQSKAVNTQALYFYFKFNYLPPHLSIYKDVRKLEPGNYIIYHSGTFVQKTYYQLNLANKQPNKYNYEEAQAELNNVMSKAVERRMISDVPLGAFLSGGIDSSVVVALASRYTSKLKTFSIGYKDNPIFDESYYANLVAKKFNTEHQVFYLTERDYKDELMNVLEYLDEPFADSSCIPQYILCKKTKKHVTVALSGDGGDEVFAGYNKHKAEWLVRNNLLLKNAASIGAPLWKALAQNKNSALGNKVRQLRKLADGASLTPSQRYIQWCSILTPQKTRNLFSTTILEQLNQHNINEVESLYSSNIKGRNMNEVLQADMRLVLPGDMLHKVDMMSMANSLEVRSPFLDKDVVDFAFQLPEEFKIDRKLKKRIVQDTFRNILPAELYNRPKQGFEIPLLEWFRTDMNHYIFDDLLDKRFIEDQGIFNYSSIQDIKRILHSNNSGNIQATIWALVVFQYWYKKYLA